MINSVLSICVADSRSAVGLDLCGSKASGGEGWVGGCGQKRTGIDGSRFRPKCKGIMHGSRWWRGAGEEETKRACRHMLTVPTRASLAADGVTSSSSSYNSPLSFYKVFSFEFLFLRSNLQLLDVYLISK